MRGMHATLTFIFDTRQFSVLKIKGKLVKKKNCKILINYSPLCRPCLCQG